MNHNFTVSAPTGISGSASYLYIGNSGTGTLNISGGIVSNNYGYLGANAGSKGTVIVTSGTWANSADLHIGDGGTGMLTINGGTVTNGYAWLGGKIGSSGTAVITSGTWKNDALTVGNSGTGAVNINGGVVTSTIGCVAYNAGSNGTVIVTSGTWANFLDLYVGINGAGTLTINGGAVTDNRGEIASGIGSSGTATVTSGKWNNSIDLRVGEYGIGALTINGGIVTSATGSLGWGFGSKGTATVTSRTLAISSEFDIGNNGTGTLTINGGTVTSSTSMLGNYAGSIGTATVTGGTWANFNNLCVGNSGTGTLNLIDSGVITSGVFVLASSPGSVGTLNIGTGGTAGILNVVNVTGGSGTATVNFNQNGSYTFAPNLTGKLSVNKLGSGTTTLTGWNNYSGSTIVDGGVLAVDGLLSTSAITVGNSGTGTLTINGGTVTSITSMLGNYAGSIGTATVTGGTWANSNNLCVGISGTGTLNLTGSGVVTSGIVVLGLSPRSIGTLNIGTGGTTGVINAAYVTGGNGTATVNFNQNGSYTFAPNLTGKLSVNKLGSGTTTLTGSSNYSESTIVDGGVLAVNGPLSTSAITIGNSGTGTVNITGSGVVNTGIVVLASSPGSIGTLNLGTGGTTGILNATFVTGGRGTASVNFNRSDNYFFAPYLTGNLSVNKLGAGTITLNGVNTYTGGTILNAGQLNINNASAIGTGVLTINGPFDPMVPVMANGPAIDNISSADIVLENAQRWNGYFTFCGSQSLEVGPVTLGTNVVVNVSANTLAIRGPIADGGNGYSLTKSGSGTLLLKEGNIKGDNTYSGSTIVFQGNLELGAANAISSQSNLRVSSGATINLKNFDQSVGSLGGVPAPNLFGPGWINVVPLFDPYNDAGAVALGSATLTVGSDNTDKTFMGVISGSGGVTKVGKGMWTLYGANTYSGTTTISSGTVSPLSANAIPNQSAVVMGSAATLVLRNLGRVNCWFIENITGVRLTE